MAIDASERPESQTPPPSAVVVRLPAEIDIAVAPALRDSLLTALHRDGPHLVADGRSVTFMDSSGVNALVRARERAVTLGGSLHVVATSPAVRRVLEITNLDERLGLVPTLEDAFACLAHPQTIHTCRQG
jgi:stage II sporulation protein AA (anti-sigma F factor antagonist)